MMPTSRCLLVVAMLACSAATSTRIADVVGTWGGDNAGLIVTNNDVHVHIGCTLGDAVGPIRTDADGRFEATGSYNVDAYPVDRGILHPATFTGRIIGQTMTLTVSLNDTARVLGPVTLVYGKEPKMGPCPICRVPPGLGLQKATYDYRLGALGGAARGFGRKQAAFDLSPLPQAVPPIAPSR